MVKHTIGPYYNADAQILILGSFPSVKSRETGFYYGHRKNRFWQVLANVYNEDMPLSVSAKKEFLKKHNLALYDCCYSCEIKGSEDASIRKVRPSNIGKILRETKVKKIFVNGRTAYNLYNKYIKNRVKMEAVYLPSTSPANARYSVNDLVNLYRVIKQSVKD